jgi:CheY-like chemotaxis protein
MSGQSRFQIIPISEVPAEKLEASSLRNYIETPPSVLIVDDEPIIADTRAAIFSTWGFTTTTAYNAKSALALVAEMSPDLLLADVDLLGMDGIELAIKIFQAAPRCKILLLTNPIVGDSLARAREAGLDFSVMAKPIQPAELRAHIENLNFGMYPAPHSHVDLATFSHTIVTQMQFGVSFHSPEGNSENRLSA